MDYQGKTSKQVRDSEDFTFWTLLFLVSTLVVLAILKV